MAEWSDYDMAAVLAAAVEQLTPVKSTKFIGEIWNGDTYGPDTFDFEVKLRNGQEFTVKVAEKN